VKDGILVCSCHIIFNKDLQMHHICQGILPRALMLEQHSDCVRISGEVNNATDDNPDFL
jgi:hypothetical protein